MTSFLIALAVLILGYVVYGAVAERVFGVDSSRQTPAYTMRDGVDYVPMPTWKVFLVQFLNIAGMGPIFGAIMGIMFGPAAFLWIVFGTIFAGAVHDFISAMMSIRHGGTSLPEIVGEELGLTIKQVMRVFSIILLLLVAAVFVRTPAALLDSMTPDNLNLTFWVVAIFAYYILATLLPIDKIIGKFYPIFGAALLFMAVGLLGYLLFGDATINDGFADGLYTRYVGDAAASHPVFPMMFVSIACGAISGFHATQSPMMARCLKNERLARPVFYGAMVAEGFVALIWAASTISFMGSYEALAAFMAEHNNNAGDVVKVISTTWLGRVGGLLAILGVIAAPITTGDTALRSARLIVADFLHIGQKKLVKRVLLSLPIFALCAGLLLINFDILWRYFAWSNQTLAAFTLWAATVYLARRKKCFVLTLIPAMFMTAVCTTYLLFARRPEGFGVDWLVSVIIGCAVAVILLLIFLKHRTHLKLQTVDDEKIANKK
jgi:carbon starvation protein CstA